MRDASAKTVHRGTASASIKADMALSTITIGPCGSVVEHSLGKGEATRSIRVMGTTLKTEAMRQKAVRS